MKKCLLFFCAFIVCLSLSAQNSWESLTATANALELKKNYQAALNYRNKALDAAKNIAPSKQQMLLGLKLYTQAEFDFAQTKGPNLPAYTLMQNSLDTLQQANAAPIIISKTYRRLADMAFDRMFKPQEAETYLDSAFEYFNKDSKKDPVYLIELMQFSGYLSILSRKYDKGIKSSEQALELFDKQHIKRPELKAKLYYNLALVHNVQFLDIPQKEYQYTVESEKILSKMDTPDMELLVLTYRRLALFEKDYRNFAKAKGFMNKAMTLYDQHKENLRAIAAFKLELSLYRALIIILSESGDEKQMLIELAKVESVVQNNSLDAVEKGAYKGILNYVTLHYLNVTPNFATAQKYNAKALAIHLDPNKSSYSLDSYHQATKINTIRLAYLKGDYHKAMSLIADAERSFGNHTDRSLLELKARSLFALAKPQMGIQAIEQLLTIFNQKNKGFNLASSKAEDYIPGNILSDAKILIHLAESFRTYSKKSTAQEEKLYWMALAQLKHNIEGTALNKDLKITFDKIVSGLMNAAISSNFSAEQNKRLLSFMESLSSQNLIQDFLLKRDIAGNTQFYKMVEEEQYLRSYITYLKKEFQKTKDENLQQQLFEKELELKNNKALLTAQFAQSKFFELPEVNLTANPKNIIKFKVVGNNLYKIRLYKGQSTYSKIDNFLGLKQEIEHYLLLLNNLESSVSSIKKQGAILYHKLFQNDFNTNAATVIIADDILHYLPFELLVKDNSYLLEKHTISYASNFYFLNPRNIQKNKTRAKKAAFFAPGYSGKYADQGLSLRSGPSSLIGAEQEVKQIAKFVAAKVFTGNSASKATFKALDPELSILHLAMHSNLNAEDPELSHLLFSNTEKDHQMHISELYGLNFNADLAVLSACNTGIGGFKDGGDIVSMHQAFTMAGIPATIASLWNAPDQSTQEIMVDFYKNLQQGLDKATALQQAKLSYLKNTKDENLQHPFYWAGFVLSGDDSALSLSGPSFWEKPLFIASLMIVLLLLVSLIYFKKRKLKSLYTNL